MISNFYFKKKSNTDEEEKLGIFGEILYFSFLKKI